jgi:hypothetical protein
MLGSDVRHPVAVAQGNRSTLFRFDDGTARMMGNGRTVMRASWPPIPAGGILCKGHGASGDCEKERGTGD